jgi:hypothetical protein
MAGGRLWSTDRYPFGESCDTGHAVTVFTTVTTVTIVTASKSKRKGHPKVALVLSTTSMPQESYGRANTKMLLPRLKSSWLLPPAATAMYCLPPIS